MVHAGHRDRLFGVPEAWNFKQCCNAECGLVWLDPMPLPEDIGKAYRNYYTHQSVRRPGRNGPIRKLYEVIKLGYLARKYHYPPRPLPPLAKSAALLLYLFPARRGLVDESVRFLPAIPRGRLLDVGCGSGEWLVSMRALGWSGEGVDFDEEAVGIARKSGLSVGCGSLEEQGYPDRSFDAITLHHVIEHLPEPVSTLKECARLLAPGGKLVVLTPNIASLGHRLLGGNWRGLEPPRHLHVMSPRALCVLLAKAGFANTRVNTRNSGYIWQQSLMLWAGQTAVNGELHPGFLGRCGGGVMTFLEGMLLTMNPSLGECILAISERN